MALEPAVGDKYYLTWAELGKPTVPSDISIPGLGTLYLDDADIYYALGTEGAAFFIRKCPALGPTHYVTVSRVQPS